MKLLKLIPPATVLAMAVSIPSFADLWKDPISTADWSVKAKPSVTERRFDNDAVARFKDNFMGVDRDKLGLEDDDLPTKPEQIGDFKWLDIDKDGDYELFVTSAASRAFYRGPSIYKSVNGKKIQLQTLDGWPPNQHIDEALEDLDGDGTPEVIIHQILSRHYRGAMSSDTWTVIYRWNGKQFEDASASFKDFYLKRLLPKVEANVREISARPPDPARLTVEELLKEQALHEIALAMQWTVHDKILRFTGQDSRAGIDRARAWAKSQNPELRTLAADVFADAGLDTYRADIQLLASDPDPYVARHVKFVLITRSRR
jgi:hypothetical protein